MSVIDDAYLQRLRRTRDIDHILAEVENYCVSGGGDRFPNAVQFRLLASEVRRLRDVAEAFDAVLGKALEYTEHDPLRCHANVDGPPNGHECTCWRAEASRLRRERI